MRYLITIAVFLSLAISASAHAQEASDLPDLTEVLGSLIDDYREVRAAGKTTHLLEIDNDTLLMSRHDGFYSSGLRYSRRYVRQGRHRATIYGWRVGQDIYTASDIKLPPHLVRPPDHPYAGWLYGGFFREVRHSDGTYKRLGIDIGCLGKCSGAEWTQTQFHRLLNQPLPQAWDRQVKNELGVVLQGETAPWRWARGAALDVIPHFNFRFGNVFTDVTAGATLRAGRLPALGGSSALYGFVRAGMTAVGYDATLQGGYFSSGNPHTVEPERLVGQAEIGMAWRAGKYGVVVSVIRHGNEIRGLPDDTGIQNYVHLQFSYSP